MQSLLQEGGSGQEGFQDSEEEGEGEGGKNSEEGAQVVTQLRGRQEFLQQTNKFCNKMFMLYVDLVQREFVILETEIERKLSFEF